MNETLEKLEQEIQNAELDSSKKLELEALVAKLKAEQESEKEGLVNDITKMIEDFESSHPQVTGLLSRVSNFLSNSGI
ncbi:hypothetical protein LNTAR_02639 [Lentisphaera araneosa HTCC2155]|jgi:hypothetical protein|uniref:Uncharacterized protein n=1 Tax=Lentisphaera araneosa HTCC2155 TaxID=313628 RepID=A6DUE7_9BACT|nr:DUF4404 family protein [Lentisphaera araneosa]EDM24745.1 hypothetical protein LNTAR_02639 [Lentisphaera araneosa HTCC2155]